MSDVLENNLKVSYFSGLNGIRALAVILVLLYHLNVPLISGGYIGVDIFFVLSGFLITRLVLKDLKSNTFSFLSFYKRRFRRLFPALFVTCLATFLYAAYFLSPYQLHIISKTTFGALASVSNFMFWPESGYFAPFAPKNPLMHTWSLGVEEQFYLFWPIALVALSNFIKRYLFICIAIIWCLSFFAANSIIHSNENSAFFLTPFRVWEFATGALLLLIPSQKNILGDALFFLGAGLVVYCAMHYDKNTLFPGFNALGPCLGTAAMIVGSGAKTSTLILENPINKYIGQISYSLYLVHWPIIIFWSLNNKPIFSENFLLLLTLTLALGVILHHFVEVLFRYKRSKFDIFAKPTSLIAMPLVTLIALGSVHAYSSGGWTWRADKSIQSLLLKKDLAKILRHGECFLARKQVLSTLPEKCSVRSTENRNMLIVGTSRAADLYYGISQNFENWQVSQITAGKCYPIITLDRPKRCVDMNKFIFEELVAKKKYDLVILGGMQQKNIGSEWRKTAEIFEKYDVDYIVMGPRSHYKNDPHEIIWKHNKEEGLENLMQSKRKDFKDFKDSIGGSKHYFSINDLLCSSRDKCKWQVDGELLYNDQSHFSEAGSIYVAKNLKKWYKETR